MLEDRVSRLPHVGLRVGVDLEHAVEALDDHHPRADVGRLQRHVGDAHDVHARRDLDEERRLSRHGEEPLRNGPEERCELRLKPIDEYVAA